MGFILLIITLILSGCAGDHGAIQAALGAKNDAPSTIEVPPAGLMPTGETPTGDKNGNTAENIVVEATLSPEVVLSEPEEPAAPVVIHKTLMNLTPGG